MTKPQTVRDVTECLNIVKATELIDNDGQGRIALLTLDNRNRLIEVLTLIDARETTATSSPTRNGARMLLPLNCSTNFGGSTEK